MAINSYGVLKGKVIDSKEGMGSSPHYQVLISDGDLLHRIAVNVKSQMEPSALLYFVDEQFEHPLLDELTEVESGFTPLESKGGGLALDFIRGNLFATSAMRPLAHEIAGPDNDLNEMIHKNIIRAIAMENSMLYAFGAKWGPEEQRDKYFGFRPGNGIHDIHMNQGNHDTWKKDDGVWQDGAMLIHLPDEERWVGIFLAFQSQCLHTDDITGHRISEVCNAPGPGPIPATENSVQVIAAMVNAQGEEVGKESVTLLNISAHPVSLEGWALADGLKRKEALVGLIAAGETRKIVLSGTQARLANKGGVITLLDDKGIKVDGVSYTKKDARKEGWTVVFTKGKK